MTFAGISVLVPAYNESATLREFYAEVCAVVQGISNDWEIIFCDDASSDDTPRIMQDILRHDSRARAIFHPHNQGIFKTFEELYRAAQKEFVILLPGDGQWPATVLPQALAKIAGHAVVIAARRRKFYTPFRRLNSWAFNRLVRWSFGIEFYDIGTVKLWRRQVLQNIEVKSHSLFNEAERLIRTHRAGHSIGVITVDHRPRLAGQARGAKLANILAAFRDLIAFRLEKNVSLPLEGRVREGGE